MTLQFAFIRNDSAIIDLTLELRGKVLLGLLSAGVSIAARRALHQHVRQRDHGLALGFIIGRLIIGIAYPWAVCRTLGLSPLGQLRGTIRPALVTAALFAGALAAGTETDVTRGCCSSSSAPWRSPPPPSPPSSSA